MRTLQNQSWKLVVTHLGAERETRETVVDADNWMSALRVAREQLGRSGGRASWSELCHVRDWRGHHPRSRPAASLLARTRRGPSYVAPNPSAKPAVSAAHAQESVIERPLRKATLAYSPEESAKVRESLREAQRASAAQAAVALAPAPSPGKPRARRRRWHRLAEAAAEPPVQAEEPSAPVSRRARADAPRAAVEPPVQAESLALPWSHPRRPRAERCRGATRAGRRAERSPAASAEPSSETPGEPAAEAARSDLTDGRRGEPALPAALKRKSTVAYSPEESAAIRAQIVAARNAAQGQRGRRAQREPEAQRHGRLPREPIRGRGACSCCRAIASRAPNRRSPTASAATFRRARAMRVQTRGRSCCNELDKVRGQLSGRPAASSSIWRCSTTTSREAAASSDCHAAVEGLARRARVRGLASQRAWAAAPAGSLSAFVRSGAPTRAPAACRHRVVPSSTQRVARAAAVRSSPAQLLSPPVGTATPARVAPGSTGALHPGACPVGVRRQQRAHRRSGPTPRDSPSKRGRTCTSWPRPSRASSLRSSCSATSCRARPPAAASTTSTPTSSASWRAPVPGATERRAEAVPSTEGLLAAAVRSGPRRLGRPNVESDARYDPAVDGRVGLTVDTLAYLPLQKARQSARHAAADQPQEPPGFSDATWRSRAIWPRRSRSSLQSRRSVAAPLSGRRARCPSHPARRSLRAEQRPDLFLELCRVGGLEARVHVAHEAVAIDQVRRRHLLGRVAARDRALGIVHHARSSAASGAETSPCCRDPRPALTADDLEAAAAVLLVQRLEHRQLLLAGRAPRGPEVDQHDLARERALDRRRSCRRSP